MFNIHRNALKAVSRFAGVLDIRYYLNGVRVQASPTETRLVATDGHSLAAHQLKTENKGFCDVIVPNDAIAQVLKWKMPKGVDTFELNGGGDAWTFSLGGQSIGFKAIDGKAPDYQRVIPSQLSGEVAQFNPTYLKRCQDAACDMLGSRAASVHVGHNGSDSALINFGLPDMVGVIMPLRPIGIDPTEYAWVHKEVSTAPAPLKAVA